MKIVFLLRIKRNNPINTEEEKLKSLFSMTGGLLGYISDPHYFRMKITPIGTNNQGIFKEFDGKLL